MPINNHQPLKRQHGDEVLPVIDARVIDDLKGVGGTDELLQRVLTLFAVHVPKSMAAVQQFSAAGDLGELADAVHALKSMCGNIGARRAAAVCDEIEHLAREGNPFDPVSKSSALATEVEAALREAERLKTH